jgi:hypothetical protein
MRTSTTAWFILLMASGASAVVVACAAPSGDALRSRDPETPASDESPEGATSTKDGGATMTKENSTPDSETDAPGSSPRCDSSKPFGPAETVPGLFDGAMSPRFTADELTVVYATSGASPLWLATRPSVDAPFGKARPLTELPLNSKPGSFVSISGDGRTVYSSYVNTLQKATRSTTTEPFGNVTELNIPGDPYAPFVTTDGNTLIGYFHPAGVHWSENGNPFSVVPIDEPVRYPVLTSDKLSLYMGRGYKVGEETQYKIMVSRRDTANAKFGPATDVAELTVAAVGKTALPSWISPDGCVLYVARWLGPGKTPYPWTVMVRRPR